MTELFLEHYEGCAPLRPCKSCRAIEFLKHVLKPSEYRKFVTIIAEGTEFAETVEDDEPPFTGEPISLTALVDDIALELPVPIIQALRRKDVRTIYEMLSIEEVEFLRMDGVGRKTVEKLQDTLRAHGRTLGEQVGKAPPESSEAQS